MPETPSKPILKIEIRWGNRTGRVTSLVGGHTAKILDLGDVTEITITNDDGGTIVKTNDEEESQGNSEEAAFRLALSRPAEVWYPCGCKASAGAPKTCPEHYRPKATIGHVVGEGGQCWCGVTHACVEPRGKE